MTKLTRPLLGAAVAFSMLSIPAVSLHAQDDHHVQQSQEHRMYDPIHKDYHDWNADEDRRYRSYLEEHHRKYKEFSRTTKKQQREYWQWRHDHERDEAR